ncbi:phosphotransferase enzyme family protein [Occallatibacter savannae]|uniref:phosphotransferase enzyme family protein n=1 Tax=Occallatibacter savannae TaxID=1002691 RepID=UPI00194E1332|nr:phosphotransferase [Occallatibacter savannae]
MNESAQPALAHGLDGSLVQPDWPALTLDGTRSVLQQFPSAGEPLQIISTSPRPLSAAAVVQTTQRRIFIKRHSRAVREIAGLAEEHRFMQHLRDNSISVPAVFATTTGDTALALSQWTYEVHALPAGIDLYEDAISWTPFRSTAHARSAGELLARMHLAAASFIAPPRKIRPLVAGFIIFASPNPAHSLAQYLAARPSITHDPQTRTDADHALELLTPLHAELEPLLPSLTPLWTHNDLHASNLFWSDTTPNASALSVIDFGLADRTNSVHDLAHCIERNIIEWLVLMNDPAAGDRVPVYLDHLWALLEGYEHIRPLSAAESAALAPMLALCHAEFALSEADYFLGVLHSPAKARVATHDYLFAHAQWFAGPGRDKLLDPIRRWSESRKHLIPEKAATRP